MGFRLNKSACCFASMVLGGGVLLYSAKIYAADINLSGLQFHANKFQTEDSGISFSTDEVQVGFSPSVGGAFKPLLVLANGVRIDTDPKSASIATNGSVYALEGAGKRFLLYTGAITLPIARLTQKVDVKIRQKKIGGFGFKLSSFKLATSGLNNSGPPEVRLMGSISFPRVAGLSLKLDTSNYISVSSVGIKLKGGSLTVNQAFYLGPIQVKAEDLSVAYTANKHTFTLKGGISLPTFWNATATLPGDGLKIVNGEPQLHGLDLSLSDIHLAVVSLNKVKLSFSIIKGEVDVDARLKLEVTTLFETDAELKLKNGVPDKIKLDFKASGPTAMIPLADTGLFINEIGGGIDHFTADTRDLTVELIAGLQVGDLSATPFSISGDMTVNRKGWKLSGHCEFEKVTGKISAGKGKALIDLEWGAGIYTIDVEVTLAEIFEISDALTINSHGDMTMLGEVDVKFPDFVPVVGNKKVAAVDFYLQIRPEDAKRDFAAAWLALDLIAWHPTVGVKAAWNQDPVLSLIGTSEVKKIKTGFHPPSARPVYQYSYSFNVPAMARSAIVYSKWSQGALDMQFSVKLPNGDVISQKDFAVAKNGLHIVKKPARFKPTNKATVIGIVNAKDRNNKFSQLKAGTYQVTMSTRQRMDIHKDIEFNVQYVYPAPELSISSVKTKQTTVTIKYNYQTAFPQATTIDWYIDWLDQNDEHKGLLIPDLAKKTVSLADKIKPGTVVTGQDSFDIADFLPLKYDIYGVIRDSKSTPVRSLNKKSFEPAARLSGIVVDDMHQDLPGWSVTLDNTRASKITNSNGFWGYTIVDPGKHSVKLNLPTDWAMMPDSTQDRIVDLKQNGKAVIESFQVQKLSVVSGKVFNDINTNGVFDQGDTPINNWTVALEIDSGNGVQSVHKTTATDSRGNYRFLVAKNKSIKVSANLPASWRKTVPFSSSYSLKTVKAGLVFEANDFGMVQTGSIAGLVFQDKNNSEKWEASDLPKKGIDVLITSVGGAGTPQKVTSGRDGHYAVSGLYPGVYNAQLNAPKQWIQSYPKIATFEKFLGSRPAVANSKQNAFHLTSADFNGDALADLAYTTIKSAIVTVLYGKGDGSFTPGMKIPVPRGLTTGLTQPRIFATDIDKDKDTDLLFWAGELTLLKNDGKGHFTIKANVAKHIVKASESSQMLLGDLNQDDYPDFIFSDDKNLLWLPNDKKGGFQSPQKIAGADNIGWIISTDFNADLRQDIAFTQRQGKTDISIYLNQGNALFKRSQQLTDGFIKSRNGAVSVDINGDGNRDLVVSGVNKAVAFINQHSTGRFTVGHDIPFAFSQLIAAELTSNGNTVLADPALGYYYKPKSLNSDIFEQAPLLGSFAKNSGIFVDADADGVLDLVAAADDLLIWPSSSTYKLNYQLTVGPASEHSASFGIRQKTR